MKKPCADDCLCGGFLLLVVVYLLVEILPAFFDGRVAAVIGVH